MFWKQRIARYARNVYVPEKDGYVTIVQKTRWEVMVWHTHINNLKFKYILIFNEF